MPLSSKKNWPHSGVRPIGIIRPRRKIGIPFGEAGKDQSCKFHVAARPESL
jgi:hypothetical protein